MERKIPFEIAEREELESYIDALNKINQTIKGSNGKADIPTLLEMALELSTIIDKLVSVEDQIEDAVHPFIEWRDDGKGYPVLEGYANK